MSSQALFCIPDARLRSLFSLLLTDSDAQVTACHDSDEFQRVLVTRFYDLCAITLDASADMAGFIKTVRYLSPDTRILLIANKEDVEQIIPLFPLGISEVLLQPINPKKAIAAIQKMIASQQVEAQSEAVEEGGAEQGAAQQGSSYRPQHVIARSPLMRTVMNQLWQARQESLGVILRGEPGSEFELLAREYQAMCGDSNGYLYVLGHHEVTSEGLATAASLDRLNDGIPRTFLIKDLELLPASQQAQLLDFLRLAKRRRDRDRPLRFVFTVADCDDKGRNLDLPFLEELLFVLPVIVKVPALRDRKVDIEPLARRILLDLTAMYPEYRVRAMKAGVTEWLAGRLWRGNHDEFCAYLRQVIMECPSRELTMAYMTMRESSFVGRAGGSTPPPPLTATTSLDTTVATMVPPKGNTTPPFGDKTGRLTAKELLATVR
ncbi:MAG: two component, sigma54 specific, transcriptional regulator, Fis family [Rariglobus sp.]|jgi:DNA-binding NtrC family response regulator|nr:two component, sigma54 specific, transcriptional regulator, Fis family [Rariglobus sp.]